MDKDEFDRAIGTPPPPTVDVDRIITRQRRVTTLRNGAPWLAAAAGIVAVAFGAVAARTPEPAGGAISVADQRGATSTAPSTTPSCDDPAAVATRLDSALSAAVQQQVQPGTGFERTDAVGTVEGAPVEPLRFHPLQGAVPTAGCDGTMRSFLAGAALTGQAEGNLVVEVKRVAGPPADMCQGVVPHRTTCEKRTGPGGEDITVMTLANGTGVLTYEVKVVKNDGTGLMLRSENVTGSGKNATQPNGDVPPLDHDQLVRIALTPELALPGV